MGYIGFDFGSSYNEKAKQNADKLVEKIDDLLERFDLSANEFFPEILDNTIGFYVSSPNMIREPEKRINQQGKVNIPNFFFRLYLDKKADNLLQGNTVILKGDLSITSDERKNYVYVRDIYLAPQTDKLDYEEYYPGSAYHKNDDKSQFSYYNEEITLDFARNIPFIVNIEKFNQFINDWRTYLEFEKAVTIGSIKRYPVSDEIKFEPVCEIVDNAVNREEFDEYIITEGGGNLFVAPNSPKLRGDEQPLFFLSINIEGKTFGNEKNDILRSAKNFARLGLSIIGQRQDDLLTELITKLKMTNEKRQLLKSKELPEIEGFDLDNWLPPEYNVKTGNVIFRFLAADEGEYRKGADPKSEIANFGNKLFLAHIATGDIALYKRGKDALDRIENGDVKNQCLAGFIIEPEKFENDFNNFNEQNIEFALKDLNRSQKDAVIKCLNSNSIFLLQGPPGTGKTQTITELVYQFNKMGKKVLLSSQTHIAIDNVIERLPKEMNILPIRLVRDRRKANEQYLPDRLLDNLYDAAYGKYRGKIEAFESCEKNIMDINNDFEANKSRHEIIKSRLSAVKKLEDERNRLIKELSELRSQENAADSELSCIKKSLAVFEAYNRTKLPFESVLDEHIYAPLLKRLYALAKKNKFAPQDDFYNYAVSFKRVAGRDRIKYLDDLSKGGKKPAELEKAENAVTELQNTINNIKKYDGEIPEKLKKEMNEALQAKKVADRKYESSGAKILNIAKEKFFFVNANGGTASSGAKSVIEEELKAINGFVNEYEEVLKSVFNKAEHDKLTDEKDALNANIARIEDDIRKISANIQKIENDIAEQNKPIESERKRLEEYFVSFYTDRLNGAALPETEEEKLDGIKEFIDNEKNKFDEYKIDFEKLQDIYSSLADYLKDSPNFIKSQRGKYTKELLKRNANVYGITCTSSPKFSSEILTGRRESDADDPDAVIVDNVNLRDIDFDVVIIDEVSKATPIEMLIPIIYGKSIVLVGDQRQLPPIFKYRKKMVDNMTEEERYAIMQGKELEYFKGMVEESLFEKIFNKLNRNRAMLTEQYRFNESIMKCVNVFYGGKLSLGLGNEQNNKKHHYLDASITNAKGGTTPIFCRKNSTYWFNSHYWADGMIAYSELREGETSYRNPLEVRITVELLLLLEEGYKKLKEKNPEEYKLSSGDGKRPSVAVITMYGKQIASIKTELKLRQIQRDSFKHIYIDISTVDNYQGKEQDIVLVNMVANTRNGKPGEFLQKFNRINVAISRARTMLIMVGSHTFYNKVDINVPDMDTGKDNLVNAYYRIYEKCESRWEASAGLFKINKEGAKA